MDLLVAMLERSEQANLSQLPPAAGAALQDLQAAAKGYLSAIEGAAREHG